MRSPCRPWSLGRCQPRGGPVTVTVSIPGSAGVRPVDWSPGVVSAMPAAAVTGDSVAANGENAAGRRHPMRRDTTILGVVVGPDLGRRGLDFGSRLIGAGEVRIGHGKPLHSHPTRSA